MTTPRAWLATTLLVALLTACGGNGQPTPPAPLPPSPPSTTRTSTFTPPGEVPRVAHPLDGSAFEQAPCTSLTTAQLHELRLSAGRKGSGDNAEQSEDNCTYDDLDPATGLIVYVNYYRDSTTGLTERYEEHWSGSWPLWKPGEVGGYPAVFFGHNPDDPTTCNVDVGISDTTVFNVKVFYYLWEGYAGQDTCGQARTIAAHVLSNIEAAN